METIKVGTSQNVAIDYPVAGLGERIAARLIDLCIFIGAYLLFIILGLISALNKDATVIAVLIWIYLACYVFYNLVLEIFMNGQTIGKRVMKIRVISLNGGQPTIGQHVMRWLFRLIDFPFTAQVGGLICIAATEKKQRIGDIVAGTTVIKTVPPTLRDHIAFHPAEVQEDYTPVFFGVHQLNDRDIELIYEVLSVYYKTGNYDLIETISNKVEEQIGITRPAEMKRTDFLQTVISDYKHITSSAI